MSQQTSVLLVEDQQLLRLGLRVTLEAYDCFHVVGEAGDGEAAFKETLRLRPDIVLMDVGLPKVDGIEATWKIKQELPRTRVVMFTSHTDPTAVSAAFGAGADAYCAKDASIEQVVSAMNAVMRGEVWLDPAIADVVVRTSLSGSNQQKSMPELELEILTLIRAKTDSREIATRLNTNSATIASMMQNIIARFITSNKHPIVMDEERKQRTHLNDWLTAFVDKMDEGTIFSEKYLIQELIGSGGLGAVFKAKHLYMDRTVALKLLRPEVSEDRLAVRSFQREATAIANLQHRNIVSIYDFGISANQEPFLVMEYVDGTNMAEMIKCQRHLSPSRVIDLSMQICDGLAEAHAKGIIHCDIKPNNILILGNPSNETVKLVDFGLVQLLPRDKLPSHQQSTDKFVVCGTPAYMSPEQCSGKPLDARSDIYSLGCVLYEALTGALVFAGATAMETFGKHVQTPALRIRSACPEANFAPDLDDLVARMLSKDPDDRPQSMKEVKKCLASIARIQLLLD